jgi:hydroxymethylpyrimidine/phosphomethylpyrimidine kinase
MKNVLSIAGSDCSGGAGIQADLKTMSALGVYGMSVIVSVVAENTSRVIDIANISPDIIEKQIDAVFEDIKVDAVKIGMLYSSEIMKSVAKKLKQYKPDIIVADPVMYAKNSCPLMASESINTFIESILPLATVLTPNIPEAECLLKITISSVLDMEKAGKAIIEMGCENALIKGGHYDGDAIDVLCTKNGCTKFVNARIHTKNTHGTGCTLASAIASFLALGCNLQDAVKKGKAYVTTAIEHSLDIGKGYGPINHFYELYKKSNFRED